MTEADKHFIETCKKIIKEGYSSKGTGSHEKVMAREKEST